MRVRLFSVSNDTADHRPESTVRADSMARILTQTAVKKAFVNYFAIGFGARNFHLTTLNMLKVGEKLPEVDLFEGDPGTVVNISEFCKDKKVVIFGVPGAFTPGCSKTHLPGYIERYLDIKKKGIDEIICISVNDAFVMDAWGKVHDAAGKIRMLADPNGTYTKLAGLDVNIPKLGGIRSKRYSMVVDKGVVTHLNVEPDGTGLSCSLAKMLPL